MVENEILIGASRDRVFAVLADAKRYAEWVVGARDVRAADGTWPRAGAKLFHSTGIGPATVDDHTEVLACEEPERLVLLAHLGPLGDFNVELQLEDLQGDGTKVVMRETALAPVGRLADPALKPRNALSLRRLKELAES